MTENNSLHNPTQEDIQMTIEAAMADFVEPATRKPWYNRWYTRVGLGIIGVVFLTQGMQMHIEAEMKQLEQEAIALTAEGETITTDANALTNKFSNWFYTPTDEDYNTAIMVGQSAVDMGNEVIELGADTIDLIKQAQRWTISQTEYTIAGLTLGAEAVAVIVEGQELIDAGEELIDTAESQLSYN